MYGLEMPKRVNPSEQPMQMPVQLKPNLMWAHSLSHATRQDAGERAHNISMKAFSHASITDVIGANCHTHQTRIVEGPAWAMGCSAASRCDIQRYIVSYNITVADELYSGLGRAQ